MKSFYDNITIKLIFLKKAKYIGGILGVLLKILLNLIHFIPIPPNFGENENLRF